MKKTHQQTKSNSFGKKVSDFSNQLYEEVDKKGMANSKIGQPLEHEDNIPPTELLIKEQCQGMLDSQFKARGGEIKKCYQEAFRAKSTVIKLGLPTDDRISEKLAEASEIKRNNISKTDEIHTTKYERAKNFTNHSYKRKLAAEQHYDAVKKDAMHGYPSWVYVFLSTVLFGGEIPLGYELFLGLGHNVLITALISLGIAGAVVIIYHFYGAYIRQNIKKDPQTVKRVSKFVNIIIISVFLSISIMRVLMTGNPMFLFFGLFNYLLFVAGTVAAFYYSPEDKLAAQELVRLKNEVKICDAELIKAEKNLEQIAKDYDREIHQIITNYEKEILQIENSVTDHPAMREYVTAERNFFDQWGTAKATEKELVSIRNTAVQRYRESNYMSRIDQKSPAYWDEPLPKLTLYFQNMKEFFAENLQPEENESKRSFKTTGIGLGLALLLSLGACESSYKPSETARIVVGIDITDSLEAASFEALPEQLMNQFANSPSEIKNYELELFLLSDVSETKTYHLRYIGASSLDNPNLIKTRQQAFKRGVDSIVQLALNQPQGKDFSRLHYPICQRLKRLARDSLGSATLVLYSDLIENNDKYSVYTEKGLELLNTEPEAIRRIFEEECGLPDLKRLHIIIAHEAKTDKDRLVLQMQSIYKQLIERKGGTFSVTATLR